MRSSRSVSRADDRRQLGAVVLGQPGLVQRAGRVLIAVSGVRRSCEIACMIAVFATSARRVASASAAVSAIRARSCASAIRLESASRTRSASARVQPPSRST